MSLATPSGIVKKHANMPTSINGRGTDAIYISDEYAESLVEKVTYASVNSLLSDLYLQISRFFPLTVSHAAKRFFYVKNQATGVHVNPSDAFSLPLNDFRVSPDDFREPARDFRASLNDFRGSLTVFAMPFRGKRRPQIIFGLPKII
jgi:hypothetical protein